MALNDSVENSTLAGVGAGVGETYLQYKLNEKSAEKAFQRQQKLLREEYDYNQQAQRNSISNMRKSAEEAGLSPIAILGQGFSPAGASASGVSSASVARPNLRPDSTAARFDQTAAQVEVLKKQLDDIQASIDLKGAQKENVDEDTRTKSMDNDMKVDANQAVNEDMLVHLRGLRSVMHSVGMDVSQIDKQIKELEEGERGYSMGSLMANLQFEDYRKKHLLNLPAYHEGMFNYKVAQIKNKYPAIAEAIAKRPQDEQHKIWSDIEKAYAEAYKAMSSGSLDVKKAQEIDANIQNTLQIIKQRYLSDPRLMIAEEDYSHFSTWLGMDVYEKGFGLLTDVIKARLGAMNAENLQQMKQAGAEDLQEMRQEGAEQLQRMKDAPSVETSYGHKMEDGSYKQTKRSYKEEPLQPSSDYKQKPARKKRRR